MDGHCPAGHHGERNTCCRRESVRGGRCERTEGSVGRNACSRQSSALRQLSPRLVRFRFLFGPLSRAADRLNRRPHRHRAGRRHRHLRGSFKALEGVQPGGRTQRISVPRTSPERPSGDAGLGAFRCGSIRRHVATDCHRSGSGSGPRSNGFARGNATPLRSRFVCARSRLAPTAQAA